MGYSPWDHRELVMTELVKFYFHFGVSQVALVVKNPPVNAGDLRDTGLIPRLGRSPGGGLTTHSSILAWKIPWTRKPCQLQSMGLQSQT